MALSAAPAGASGRNVDVQNVAAGSADFQFNGSNVRINVSDNAIINYHRFDIPQNHLVEFVQRGVDSRVLNRVTSNVPSYIDGTLQANGQVYLVNPAGVMFGQTAVINVGQFFAAAGNITDQDFLAGQNRFVISDADLINRGSITGADGVHLMGHTVQNLGVIHAPNGVVSLSSGEEVYIREEGSAIMVSVDHLDTGSGQPLDATDNADPTGKAGVVNEGSVTGQDVFFAVGDVYSLALVNAGDIEADNVTLAGNGQVAHTGTIDVSNDDGVGGTAKVLGDTVAITGDINASGSDGGGEIHIGGVLDSENETFGTADNTFVASTASLRADATDQGDGGTVTVQADESVIFDGAASARGGPNGGDGGFIAFSGDRTVVFGDGADADTSAPQGADGSILLRSDMIDIIDGEDFDDDVYDRGDGINLFADEYDGGYGLPDDLWAIFDELDLPGATLLSVDDLQDVSGNLILEAFDSIRTRLGGGEPPTEPGDWETIDLFNLGPGQSISLLAGNEVLIYDQIITNGGDVIIRSGVPGLVTAIDGFPGGVDIAAPIRTNGGDLTIEASGLATLVQQLQEAGIEEFELGLVSDFLDFPLSNSPVSIRNGATLDTAGGSARIAATEGDLLFDGVNLFTSGGDIDLAANGQANFRDTAIAAGSGDIRLVTGGFLFTDDVQFNGSGLLTLAPIDPAGSIGIGAEGDLWISRQDLESFNDGFAGIIFGDAVDGAHVIQIGVAGDDPLVFTDPVTFAAPKAGGEIFVNAPLVGLDDASFTFLGSGNTTTLGADIITASNPIVFNDSVILASDVNIDATNNNQAVGANVAFNGDINAMSGAENLVVSSGAGDTAYNGAIGADNPLAGITIVSADNVSFNAPVNTTGSLAATTSGDLNLSGGNTYNLGGGLTHSGAGQAVLGGQINTTGGAVIFNAAVSLVQGLTINTTAGGADGGQVAFNNTVNSAGQPQSLSLITGLADLFFGSTVGTGSKLGDVVIGSANDVTANNTFVASSLTQLSGTGNTTFADLVTDSGTANITTAGLLTLNVRAPGDTPVADAGPSAASLAASANAASQNASEEDGAEASESDVEATPAALVLALLRLPPETEIDETLARQFIDAYEAMAGGEQLDTLKAQLAAAYVRGVDEAEAAGAAFDAAAWAAALEDRSDAATRLTQINAILDLVDALGLNASDARTARMALLERFRPEVVPMPDFETALAARRVTTPAPAPADAV